MKRSTHLLRLLCLLLAVLTLTGLLALTAVADDAKASLASYHVTLGEDIGLSVEVSAPAGAEVTVAFTYRGTTTFAEASAVTNSTQRFDFHGALPQHLDEPITVAVMQDGNTVDTRTVSVADYCRALPAEGARATAGALLLYGAAARRYTALADATDLSSLPKAEEMTAFVPIVHEAPSSDAPYVFEQLGLMLSNNVSAYLDLSVTEGAALPTVKLLVGDASREAILTPLDGAENILRVSFPLKASELLHTEITVTAYDGASVSDTVTFGAAAYLRILAEDADVALSTLARAIYRYALTACDFADGHAYETVGTSKATCGADGVTVERCTVCGDLRSEKTPALGMHERVSVTVEDGIAVCRCADCGDVWRAEDGAYALGHETGGKFDGAASNKDFNGGDDPLPTATEGDGNVYYALIHQNDNTSHQGQFYGNNVGTSEEQTHRKGLISLRLKQPTVGLDADWSLQLFNLNGTWGAHGAINAKGIPILGGTKGGTVYAADRSKGNVGTLATLSATAWTRFDILFEKENTDLILSYYVDGELKLTRTIENTMRARTPCGIYFTASSTTTGSSFYFDDVIFAYTDTERSSFFLDRHTFEAKATVPPTCFEEGFRHAVCTACGEERLEQLSAEHRLGEATVTPASCFTDGVSVATCSLCGLTVRESIPATGSHTYGAWTTVKAPTTVAEGLEQQTCSVCGDVAERTVLRLSASNINALYLTGDWQSATKTKDVTMQVVYVPTEGEGFSCHGTIHWQGASSLGYPEKNYTLKLYKDETLAKKNKVDLGWGKESKYCLKANWVDCTSSRNVVACRLWGDVVATRSASALQARLTGLPTNAGAIDGFPIALYMNGSFHGVYTLNVPKDEWMFAMDDVESEAMLMANDWNNSTFRTTVGTFALDSYGDWVANGGAWELKYFGTEKTTGSPQWVTDSFNDLILFCQRTQNDGAAFRAGIDQYLDMDATIDYLLYFYAIYMRDNSAKNILWATYDGKVWFPSVYDLDGTFGMAWDGIREALPTGQLPQVLADGTIEDGIYDHDSLIIWNVILNEYSEEILDRYYELREQVLTEEHMEVAFGAFLSEIPADVLAAERAKWTKPGIGKFEWAYIDQWIPARLAAMDQAMAAMAEATGYGK